MWTPMMPESARKGLMAALVACFAIQGALVYLDQPSSTRLGGPALDGARAWQRHNCNVCHQVYGWGGFLGPDLTNVAGRLGEGGLRARMARVTAEGSGQMPPIPLEDGVVDALVAWFVALDRTGVGQLRAPAEADVVGRIDPSAPEAVRRGQAILLSRPCLGCHGLAEARVGPAFAGITLDDAALDLVLREGRAPRMPRPDPPFTEAERSDVAAFVRWTAARREALAEPPVAVRAPLAWWEYPR
jgi:nitric oxide reductase subunit C